MTSEFDELDNCLYIQITEEIDHHIHRNNKEENG